MLKTTREEVKSCKKVVGMIGLFFLNCSTYLLPKDAMKKKNTAIYKFRFLSAPPIWFNRMPLIFFFYGSVLSLRQVNLIDITLGFHFGTVITLKTSGLIFMHSEVVLNSIFSYLLDWRTFVLSS